MLLIRPDQVLCPFREIQSIERETPIFVRTGSGHDARLGRYQSHLCIFHGLSAEGCRYDSGQGLRLLGFHKDSLQRSAPCGRKGRVIAGEYRQGQIGPLPFPETGHVQLQQGAVLPGGQPDLHRNGQAFKGIGQRRIRRLSLQVVRPADLDVLVGKDTGLPHPEGIGAQGIDTCRRFFRNVHEPFVHSSPFHYLDPFSQHPVVPSHFDIQIAVFHRTDLVVHVQDIGLEVDPLSDLIGRSVGM